MNYYNRHIGDYAKQTAHLTFAEDGAYNRLLDYYYATEEPLTLDMQALYRKVRARSKPEQQMIDRLLVEFFNKRDDGWHKNRCDEEIEKYKKKADANRENGSHGGRPRKPNDNPTETQSVSKDNPNHNPNETLANSQEPIASSHGGSNGAKPPRRKPATKPPDSFEVTDEMAQWAVSQGLSAERVLPETEKCLDHFRGAGVSKADWQATWRNWIRKSVEYGTRR